MNVRITFYHGLSSGLLAALASYIYLALYKFALGVDYSLVLNPGSITGASITGTLLASLGYLLLDSSRVKSELLFNGIFTLLTFTSFLGPLSYNLPSQIEMPELFLGATFPMHIFPQLFWLTIRPLWYVKQHS